MSGFNSKTTRYDINTSSNSKAELYNIYSNIQFGEVISIKDDLDMGRIKVRVIGIDDKYNILDNDLVSCMPLQPKFFHVIPKVGEIVKVFLSDIKRPFSLRYWIGPVISQPQFYNNENKITALNSSEYGLTTPSSAPSKIENAKGIYPEVDEIAILGRDNNDIILKDKQVTLRVGKHIFNNNLRLNRKNPGYINLRMSDDGELTTIMTVANKIGIMSHNGKRKFNSILDSDEIDRFFEESHPMLKGDLTLEVLKKIINAVLFHVHGGSGVPPASTNPILELEKIDLNRIISENIRIN
jgi:hypothetical protein